jgi:acyl-CoA synthetase (AMP-forming)/AMP-acid ligase II
VDERGQPLPPGQIGELVVRGPHVMRGYWNRPAETAGRFRPDPLSGQIVLYTGDLFRTDGEGFLYFVGRKDDMVKSRGEKVSPKEIENVLYALEGVREAAVVGRPDALLGEAIVAFVALASGSSLTPQAVRAHCARHLEDFMVPSTVHILPDLPKGSTGKIDRAGLRSCAASSAD